jgi:hypothetical protein
MKNNQMKLRLAALAAVSLGAFAAAPAAQAAATLLIFNGNAPGVGFNDPTPAAPVGGNPGTTLGQQRLNAFQHAASIWGATLNSATPITILATFEPLACSATGATLGSAGATTIWRDFGVGSKPATWYSAALAEKMTGVDMAPGTADIRARFNVNLGTTACPATFFWYLGLDNNHGAGLDLVTVLLHEFGHGLGFQTFTSGTSGAQIPDGTNGTVGYPSVWDHFLLDTTVNLHWKDMTNAQRVASAINTRKLVWDGALVTAAAPGVLAPGVPLLKVSGANAGAVTGQYIVGRAAFGAPLSSPGVSGDIMPVTVNTAAGDACVPLSATDKLAVNGNIALINRGVCGFVVKVKNAQDAGAKAVIIADNAAGSPPPDLGGTDPAITIPSVRITLADGNLIRTALTKRSRNKSGVVGNLTIDGSQLNGADAFGRAQVYTPNPFVPGSSVSHYDVGAFPNVLMEPSINADLTHSVVVPQDLTYKLLQDTGW